MCFCVAEYTVVSGSKGCLVCRSLVNMELTLPYFSQCVNPPFASTINTLGYALCPTQRRLVVTCVAYMCSVELSFEVRT